MVINRCALYPLTRTTHVDRSDKRHSLALRLPFAALGGRAAPDAQEQDKQHGGHRGDGLPAHEPAAGYVLSRGVCNV